MKRMIIVAVVGLSVLAIGLLGVTAFAYNLGQQPSQQTGLCSSTSVQGLDEGLGAEEERAE